MSNEKSFYFVREFAETFGLSDETVRDWIRDKRLKAIKAPSGRWMITREEFSKHAQEKYGE
jgi:hypothetical protein